MSNEYDELETKIIQAAVDVVECELMAIRMQKLRELMLLIDECSPIQWDRIVRPPEGIKTPRVRFAPYFPKIFN